MKTILEAENAYREAERELKDKQYRRDKQLGLITLAFGAGGLLIFIIGLILGLFVKSEANSPIILSAVGAFLLAYAAFRIHQARMQPDVQDERVDRAFDELSDAQLNWLRSAGFEVSDETLDAIGFDYLPERIKDETFGSTQLLHTTTGKVIPVVLKLEIGKGYVLYGPEGQLLQERTAVGKV